MACEHTRTYIQWGIFNTQNEMMNSINWPALSVWVFIAQLVEHCSANAEATGSNPIEVPKKRFSCFVFQATLQFTCLNCNSTAMVTHSFHLY